jgi:hypothetical protein
MIFRFHAIISPMSALEDDPLVLSYFLYTMETMVGDIINEILEVVNISCFI